MFSCQPLGGFALASSLVVAGFLSIAPAGAQFNGLAGSNPPPAPQLQQPAGNPALAQFRNVLDRFGTVINHPRYGEVWTPAQGVVPPGWSPYPACHWTYDNQQQAWTYKDPTEWGTIVHHHGRWAFEPQTGWLWIADTTYGPGWVYWRNDAQTVSWAALRPEADGQPVPTDGWQNQDMPTFSSGCQRPVPAPAPVAYQAMPAPAPLYASAPIPVSVPVYVPGRLPPPPIVMVDQGPTCLRFPFSRGCRPHTPPGGVDCRFPSFARRPECVVGQHRPVHVFPRPSHFGQFGPRPRLMLVARPFPRPVVHPVGFRPGGFRPAFAGPRPSVQRPSFVGRPIMNRPMGGGARFARRF